MARKPRACPELNITGVLCFLRRAGSAPRAERRCAARPLRETRSVLRTLLCAAPGASTGYAERLARCPTLRPARPHVLRLGRR